MDKLSFYEPADIEIYIKDRGIVLKEKSLIAIEMEEKIQKILAIGNEAERMFAHFLKKAIKQNLFRIPSISLCIPFQIDRINLKAYEEIIYMSGKSKKVKFIFKSLEEFLQNASPKELNEHKIIINITKDNPVEYIKERAKETIQYANQYGVTKDWLLDVIKEL